MRLITDSDTERMVKLTGECDEKFLAWQKKMEEADELWDEAIQADAEENVSVSTDLMMQVHGCHGEIIRLWYEFLQVRKEYLCAKLELGY